MAERQYNISDVKLKSVNLYSESFLRRTGGKPYDLLPHLRELNIHENIFSNSLTGNITLDESVNLPALLPIVGEERIEIKFETAAMEDAFGDDENKVVLFVHKTLNQELKTPQSQSFSLELVSEQYLSNAHSRISKSFKNKSNREIAFEIYQEYLLPTKTKKSVSGLFEFTHGTNQCVIPNWTPYEAINWLAKRSIAKTNKNCANFVYFETLTGDYFRSLDSLMLQRPVILFVMEGAYVDPFKVDKFSGSVMRCEEITVAHKPELIKNINRGTYCSKLITHDIVTKKIIQHDYSLQESWDKTEHLNKKPPVNYEGRPLKASDKRNQRFAPSTKLGYIDGGNYKGGLHSFSDSMVMFAPKHNKLFSENPDHEYDNGVENWKLQRNSQMTLFDGVKFYVQCGGIPALRVGLCVDIHMLSPESYEEHGSSEDKSLSGTCMVTAIRHIVSNNLGNTEYKMWLELSKDGIGPGQFDGIGK